MVDPGAKCYSSTIGGPDVRQYVNLQHRPGVDGAIVVSSGPFSEQAHQEEKDHNLKLIDGDGLTSLIKDTSSYDLVDQYIDVDSSVSSQSSGSSSFSSSYSSEQSSFDSSYSSEPISSEMVESSTESAQSPPVSSDSSNWSRHSKGSEGETRLYEYFDKIRTTEDVEEGIRGLQRILFEEPPRNNWWKAIVGTSAYWVLLFLIVG